MPETAIDTATIDGLRELGLDLLDEVVGIFVAEAPKRVLEIEEAANAGNAERVWKSAHELRSVASNVGALRLARLCDTAQEIGYAGSVEGMDKLAAEMRAECEIAARELLRINDESRA